MSKRDDSEGGDYEVGFGKPPKRTQFKPGQSGNAKGRPRGKPNVQTLLARAVQEQVTVTEKGKRKSITKLEVVFKQMVNKAAAGDARARQDLLSILLKHGSPESSPDANVLLDAESDARIFDRLFARYVQSGDTALDPRGADDESQPSNGEPTPGGDHEPQS